MSRLSTSRTDDQIRAALLENAPEAHLAFLDADFRFVFANPAYLKGCGLAEAEVIGRNHFELFPNEENEAIFRHARETGEPISFRAKPFEYADQPWRGVTYWDWTIAPVPSNGSAVDGFVLSLADMTEPIRHLQLAQSLARLDALIHSTLDFQEVMRRLVEEAADVVGCESAGIALRENDTWVAAYASAKLRESAEGRRFGPNQFQLAEMTAERRRPVIANVDTAEPDMVELLGQFGIKSALNIPLYVGEEVVGVLGLHYHSAAVRFSPIEIEFATTLGRSTSVALQNARLYEDEHRVADALRRALSRPTPLIEGVEVGVTYRPADDVERVGGDFYDVFELDGGLVAAIVGDVSGKGLRAATTTETVRGSVRALAYTNPSPAWVMTRLNEALVRQLVVDMFVTAVFVVFDPVGGEVRCAVAGHPQPAVCGPRAQLLRTPVGPLLGAFRTEFAESSFRIGGETLLLYTDGMIEARQGGEVFGQERLIETMAAEPCAPEALTKRLLDEVMRFGGGRLWDDVALVALRVRQ